MKKIFQKDVTEIFIAIFYTFLAHCTTWHQWYKTHIRIAGIQLLKCNLHHEILLSLCTYDFVGIRKSKLLANSCFSFYRLKQNSHFLQYFLKYLLQTVQVRCLKKFGGQFRFFTPLGFGFGHLMCTTWSIGFWIGSVVTQYGCVNFQPPTQPSTASTKYFSFTLGGHAQTTCPFFFRILTPPPPFVDKRGHFDDPPK